MPVSKFKPSVSKGKNDKTILVDSSDGALFIDKIHAHVLDYS